FDDGKENAVVAIDHRHVFDVALLFGKRRRPFDVAEKNRHRRAQFLEFLFGLRTGFQQFLESVSIHCHGLKKLYNKRKREKGVDLTMSSRGPRAIRSGG